MSFGYQVLGFGSGGAGAAPYMIEYLVIAGGAQGGRSDAHGGGGGAGGYRTAGCYELTSGCTYTATIGAGGTGPYPNPSCSPFYPIPCGSHFGSPGINSVFGTITSEGGGAGVGQTNSPPGIPGGSGGGGGHNTPGGCGSMDAFGNPKPSQGYAGGTANHSGPYHGAGGGGGAGAVGFNGASGAAGKGGAGVCSAIDGIATTRASGGSGSGNSGGCVPATPGGGGASYPGASNPIRNGIANTGGGSGAARAAGLAPSTNSVGGSGVIYVRIPTANYTGISTGSPNISIDGVYTILEFTGTGTYTA
jgi:hypothetical protein